MCICVCPRIGAHTVHPIAMKLSQVVRNMLAVVLEIKKKIKIALAGVPGVALKSTHHSSDCDETFTSCFKHARRGFGKLYCL